MANKVRYGFKSLYYATVTFATDGTPTFGTVFRFRNPVRSVTR